MSCSGRKWELFNAREAITVDPYAPLKLDHHWIRLVDEAGTCFFVGWWGPPMTPYLIAAKPPAPAICYLLRPFTLSVLYAASQ